VTPPPPRYGTPRSARPTRGGLDRQVAALLGWQLFPWQTLVADVAGEYDPVTKVPSYRTAGVGVARQNGKTTLVCSRIARQLIPPRQTVAYTAQDRGLARTKWGEHVDLLMSTPFAERVERIDRTNHRECLTLYNGSRYMPVTPSSRKAGRSLSIDLAVVDEAHAHETMGVISAIQPAMAARPHAQIWVLSNAGDHRSGLWRHYTDLGRSECLNPSSTMCWFEWAPTRSDYLDVLDRQVWAEANPSLGLPHGIIESALADGALTMDRDTFLREHLNVWAEGGEMSGIDPVVWAACQRDDLVPTGQLAISVDFTPLRDRGALVAAGNGDSDITALEVIEHTSDLSRLIGRCIQVAQTWEATVVIDRGSPAASAIPFLEQQPGVSLRVVSTTDMARACGDFHDAALLGRLSHRGDHRLTDAVIGATKRFIGDTWVWQRRGASDITPLTAATLARWGVTAFEPLIPAIY
jgi:hypothetical protein